MTGIVERIMAEFESDPTINVRSLNVVLSSHGIIKKRQTLDVYGEVGSPVERSKILGIVQRQAGTSYEVEDKMVVH
jgi:hypothetical protein